MQGEAVKMLPIPPKTGSETPKMLSQFSKNEGEDLKLSFQRFKVEIYFVRMLQILVQIKKPLRINVSERLDFIDAPTAVPQMLDEPAIMN
jgi:hypothetical protein